MFRDREEAGRLLAEHLKSLLAAGKGEAAVLGVPRGGVIVAAAVATALGAPLDVIVPRKLGAPDNPELAVGALALAEDEEIALIDDRTVRALGVSDAYLQEEIERQRREILRREAAYREGRPPEPVEGRVALLVDDGVATGLTARAAARAVLRRSPREVVVAVPVAPPETVREFAAEGVRLEALETPWPFGAVGRFYLDFRQVEDEEVIAVLRAHRQG
ncbi:MAG: phosphoribosyltransferase [Acidobacteria bacterium]|nr:MAG: phosphoribosyltransferase [Acidobacteriota bacterium]